MGSLAQKSPLILEVDAVLRVVSGGDIFDKGKNQLVVLVDVGRIAIGRLFHIVLCRFDHLAVFVPVVQLERVSLYRALSLIVRGL